VDDDYLKFKALLEKEHTFPCEYLFKFIVPFEGVEYIKRILGDKNIKMHSSKTGKYLSINLKKLVNSSDEIIEVYKEAQNVIGIIAL